MNPGGVEKRLWRIGFRKIAGVDEAGRGPLAGPVVAAAVVIPAWPVHSVWAQVRDSKRLSPATRERLFEKIRGASLEVSVAVASSIEIDRKNILQATLNSMRTAVLRLRVQPDIVLVDGNKGIECPMECRCLVGGDQKALSIAAASIVAKVVRDRIMTVYARRFPQYGFERNRGYPTLEHREALKHYGTCPIHRRSFRLKKAPGPWPIPPWICK